MRDFDKQMEMVLYHSDEGDVSVDAYIKDESIWITQKAMAELFGVQVPAISKHLKKIFEEGELDEKVVVSKMEITSPHGAIPDKTQPENDKPSYHFYHKNGFKDLDAHISLYKSVRVTEKSEMDIPTDETESIIYDIANLSDIPELIRLRILYMIDDFGSISDKEKESMEDQLPGYFERELGKKLIAFVARAEGRLVAAAYLLII